MRLANPQLLWLLAAIPVLLLFGWWALVRRRRELIRFAGGETQAANMARSISVDRRVAKRLLVLTGVAFAVVALARPQWGTRLEEVEREGADVLFVLDHSLSMRARDVAPDRLELARHLIGELSERLVGDRVGLVSFSGTPELSCPLTLDHGALRLFLDTIDTEATPVPGTALAEALALAVDAFERDARQTSGGRHRAIVLLTDGEDHEGAVDAVLPRLEQAGVSIYAIGAGTQRGAPIPVEGGFKKDAEGKVVTTRLDEALLAELATETGGRYFRGEYGGDLLDRAVDGIRELDRAEFQATMRARYEERFQVPLGIGLLVILLESLLGDRRRRQNAQASSSTGGGGE